MLKHLTCHKSFEFDDWLGRERDLREQSLKRGRRFWRKYKDMPPRFWWEMFGILPEESELLE